LVAIGFNWPRINTKLIVSRTC